MDPIDFSPGILGDLALAGSGASGASSQIRAPSNIVGNSFAPAHVGSGLYGQPQNPTAPLSAALLPRSTYAPATPLPGVREGIIPYSFIGRPRALAAVQHDGPAIGRDVPELNIKH